MCRGENVRLLGLFVARLCKCTCFPSLTAANFLEGMFIGFIYFPPHPTNRIKFVFITFLESCESLLARDFFFEERRYVRLKMKNSQGVYHCHVPFVTCLNECV